MFSIRKTKWFDANINKWFDDGGILQKYDRVNGKYLHFKFNLAQADAKDLWNRRSHQPDTSGNLSEGQWTSCTKSFFELFEFLAQKSSTNSVEEQFHRSNVKINRSIISQQPALSSGNPNAFLSSVAPSGRMKGSVNIGSNITMNIVEQLSNTGHSINGNLSDRKKGPTPMNNGRAKRNNHSLLSKVNDYLPPSTKGVAGVNVSQIHCDFNAMAGCFNTLFTSDRCRKVHEINDAIINMFKERKEMEKDGECKDFLDAYDKKIVDLKEERKRSEAFEKQMMDNMNTKN